MKKFAFPLGYIAALTCCLPLTILYISVAAALLSRDGTHLLVKLLLAAAALAYWGLIAFLWLGNIWTSFRMYRRGDLEGCVKGMLLHKYGLVVFFVVNYLVILLCTMVFGIVGLMGSRGTILLALPVLLPWMGTIFAFLSFLAWLALMPGGFFGLQVIRASVSQGMMGPGKAILHGLLQFTFCLDVLDAMDLSVRYWKMGKKSAAVIGVLYLLALIGILAGAVMLFGG